MTLPLAAGIVLFMSVVSGRSLFLSPSSVHLPAGSFPCHSRGPRSPCEHRSIPLANLSHPSSFRFCRSPRNYELHENVTAASRGCSHPALGCDWGWYRKRSPSSYKRVCNLRPQRGNVSQKTAVSRECTTPLSFLVPVLRPRGRLQESNLTEWSAGRDLVSPAPSSRLPPQSTMLGLTTLGVLWLAPPLSVSSCVRFYGCISPKKSSPLQRVPFSELPDALLQVCYSGYLLSFSHRHLGTQVGAASESGSAIQSHVNDSRHKQLLENFRRAFEQIGNAPDALPQSGVPSPTQLSVFAASEKTANIVASGREKEKSLLRDVVADLQHRGGAKLDVDVEKEAVEVLDSLMQDKDATNNDLLNRLTNLVKRGALGEPLKQLYEAQEREQDEAEAAEQRRRLEAGVKFDPDNVEDTIRRATADPLARRAAKAILSAGNADPHAIEPHPGAVTPNSNSVTTVPNGNTFRSQEQPLLASSPEVVSAASGGGQTALNSSAPAAVQAEDRRIREAAETFARESGEKGVDSIGSQDDLFDILRGSTTQYLEQLNVKPAPPGQTALDDGTVVYWKEDTDLLQVWIPLPSNYIRESIQVYTSRARLRVACQVTTAGGGTQVQDVTIVDKQMKGYIVGRDTHWALMVRPSKSGAGNQHFVHAVGPKRTESRSVWGALFGEPPSREEWMLQNDERYTHLDGTKPPPPHVLEKVPELGQPEVQKFIDEMHRLAEQEEAQDKKQTKAGG